MKIIWLGHAGFRIEIEDQVLLVDPWFSGNPVFPEDRKAEVIAGASRSVLGSFSCGAREIPSRCEFDGNRQSSTSVG